MWRASAAGSCLSGPFTSMWWDIGRRAGGGLRMCCFSSTRSSAESRRSRSGSWLRFSRSHFLSTEMKRWRKCCGGAAWIG
ncbi:unnamed protein product [Linum tenue]|uniref:Secreted protein n=1 Tax=Linum tenue TaxID=586396 RepID=A0AAV0H116_9ROSI|nr:unnamed protein product [Linum tenue]